MNNAEVLNAVDFNNAQAEELANTVNVNAELSEEQLNNVNGGFSLGDIGDVIGDVFKAWGEAESHNTYG
jgi:bacteriocin-like protein